MRYASEQPQDGDIICHCGHVDAPKHHAYHFRERPVRVEYLEPKRGVHETFETSWIVLCDDCDREVGADAMKALDMVRAHGVWVGNEPMFQTYEVRE